MRPDGLHLHVPAGLGAAAQYQVHLMPVEQGADPVTVAGLQPNANPRMAAPEATEQPGQDLLGRRGDGGYAQLAPLGSAAAAAASPASSSRPRMRRT